MGSSELYQYLVKHSYRPNKQLDALHEVSQYIPASILRAQMAAL